MHFHLERTNPDNNYSQITNNIGQIVETSYSRIRIDPINLELNLLDDTFAETTNSAEEFVPTYPGDLEFVPLGWAEMQADYYIEEVTPAESNIDLTDTAFEFDASVADNFCLVNNPTETVEHSYDGTEGTISDDSLSLNFVALNRNSEEIINASTRMVGDCDNLGVDDVSIIEEGFIPVVYTTE